MTEAMLSASGLSVRRGRRVVVTGVSFKLHPGETIAVLGPNGAGKSSLVEALGGVIPTSSGELRCQGRMATALQSPDLANRTVRDNIHLALSWWGVPHADRQLRTDEALEVMGIASLADRRARALSGGERRRVHLARTLALRPDVLLLDEPFAGLDAEARSSLVDDVATGIRRHARAAIIVLHDRPDAWALADRILILIDGKLEALMPPERLLADPPTPDVARFLGYTGEVREAGRLLLLRPADVVLDPAGDILGKVERVVRQEVGSRIDLVTPTGQLQCVTQQQPPQVGDEVMVRCVGGVRFSSELSRN